MSNNIANRLDEVRAAAIYNTTKRINEAKEKANAEKEQLKLAQEMHKARELEPELVKKGK